MKQVRLENIFEYMPKSKIKAGEGKKEGKYKFFTSSNIQDKYIDEFIYDGEYLIFGTGGKASINYCNEKFSTSTDNFVVKVKKDINTKFVYLYFKNDMKKLENGFKGASIKHISKDYINQLMIPMYDFKMQEKIVKELDKVQEIINQRKKQIKELDELIQSLFVEMFDNIEEKIRLGDSCEVHARIGWQSLTKNEHMQNGKYILVTGTDFKNNEIDYSSCVYVSKERYEMDKNIMLKNDDILITKDGTIGKVAIVHDLKKPATLNGGIFVIRPNQKFNKEYIAYVFKGPLFEEYIDKSKTGATIKHLNQKHLVEFEIPVPPMEIQNQFADIVKQIDKQKFIIEKSLKEAEELQESLMNEYFY